MSMVYLKMHVENVYIKCLIDYLKRIEEQRSLSAKIYTRDKRLNFRNYVLALFHEMAPSGKINQLLPKIIIPRIFQAYKKSKEYRLAMVIHESTIATTIADMYERVWAGHAIEYCLHSYHHPSRFH